VRELIPEFKQYPFENEIVWNGLDNDGNFVRPGSYTLKVSLEPTYSSKNYFEKELIGTVTVVSSEAEDKEKGTYGEED
jgi:flagellar hook assembly protein FlgD